MKIRLAAVTAPLALGLALAASPAAQGAPTDQSKITAQAQAVTPSATVSGKSIYDISSARRKILVAMESVEKHALNKKHTHLNWPKAKKYDKGKYTDLKKFAAWFEWSGRKLDSISKKDHKAVRKYRPSRSKKSVTLNNPPANTNSNVAVTPSFTNNPNAVCTGYKGVSRVSISVAPYVYMYKYDIWLNSCTTNAIRYALNGTAAVAGVAAAFIGPAAPAAIIVGAVLVIGSERLQYHQSNSSNSAVWITLTPPDYLVHYYSQ